MVQDKVLGLFERNNSEFREVDEAFMALQSCTFALMLLQVLVVLMKLLVTPRETSLSVLLLLISCQSYYLNEFVSLII